MQEELSNPRNIPYQETVKLKEFYQSLIMSYRQTPGLKATELR